MTGLNDGISVIRVIPSGPILYFSSITGRSSSD